MKVRRLQPAWMAALALTGLLGMSIGCSDGNGTGPISGSLTVYGSNSSVAVSSTAVSQGSPTSVKIKVYAAYISPNADCTDAVEVADYGATPREFDFAATPTLFSASPADGTYRCLILKMNDNVRFKVNAAAVAAFPAECVDTTTEYVTDIYRHGEADDGNWKDIDGAGVDATGTAGAPGEDTVYIFATTSVAAATGGALGVHTNQALALSGALTLPGSPTFFFDANDGVNVNGANCWLEDVTMGFR